jgi:hypothetical protein
MDCKNWVLRRVIEPKIEKEQEAGENSLMRTFLSCLNIFSG